MQLIFFVVVSGEEAMLGDQSYRYLTADEMKSLGDDSLPIDVTKDEKQQDAIQAVKQFGGMFGYRFI